MNTNKKRGWFIENQSSNIKLSFHRSYIFYREAKKFGKRRFNQLSYTYENVSSKFRSTKKRNQELVHESSKSTLFRQLTGEIVYGIMPVLSALKAGRRNIYRLLVIESNEMKERKVAASVERARFLAKSQGAHILSVSRHDLNMFTNNHPHQGLALDCSPLDLTPIIQPPTQKPGKKFPERKHAFWLALDEITDSQNLGAIARSAFFLGVDGLVVCSKNTAPINAFASKASAGALEYLTVCNVSSLPTFLARCSEEGWSVLGAANSNRAIRACNYKVNRSTILVVGNEGTGLRTAVRRVCTDLVKITAGISGEELKTVDSLNVSVATGILINELLKIT